MRTLTLDGGGSGMFRSHVGSTPGEVGSAVADQDGLGLGLFRVEEAALAWGRPLDGYDPAPGAFDPAKAAAVVRRLGLRYDTYRADVVFPVLPFDGVPGVEEARWWLWWMRCVKRDDGDRRYYIPTGQQRLTRAAERYLTKEPPVSAEVWSADNWFLRVAAELTVSTPQQVLALHRGQGAATAPAVPALRALVVPQLTELERAETRRSLPDDAPLLDRLLHSALFAEPAAHLELLDQVPDELAAMISVNDFARHWWDVLVAVLAALPSVADAVETAGRLEHGRRRRQAECHFHPRVVPGLLGVLGSDALSVLEEQICAAGNKQTAEAHLAFLAARVRGPAVVPTMINLAAASKAPGAARDWLIARPQALAANPTAFKGKAIDVVMSVVRQVLAGDAAAFDRDVANPTVVAAAAALRAEVAMPLVRPGSEPPWWLDALLAEERTPADTTVKAFPAYAEPGALPPVVVDGVRLNQAMAKAVLGSAMSGADGVARPLVAAVRDRMSLVDRDAVATALLNGWLEAGAPTKGKGVFGAAGYLGADGFVAELVPLVRDWPGQSHHQRAVLGLTVLVATGRLSALQGISGIASKSKFKAIQEAARAAMDRLAAAAGLSTDQLADRVVPDGGLDERGTTVLSFGPRSFRVRLSPQGKLVVHVLDADGRPTGKPRTGLPAANSKDDPAAVAAAKSRFTVLRKQLTDLAKVQTARLEQAMVSGRTWSGVEHRDHLVGNPLLNSLIRPLVWAVTEGRARTLVRITEDREYLSVDDDVVVPGADAVIALAHPLHLSDAERTAWQEHLISYDLLPPIEQLDRAVFGLPAGQRGPMLDPSALPQGQIHPGTLVGLLDRYGWRRGNPADAGVVNYAWLAFPSHGQAVVIEINDGLWTGSIADSGDQRIGSAVVTTPEVAAGLGYVHDRMRRFDWQNTEPVIVSETLRTFAAMAEKAT